MRTKALLRRVAAIGACLLAAGLILNIDVAIKQGVNGRVREIHMPLYVKAMEFVTRHYEYGRIAREATRGCKTDEEKVLAVLKWTRENIKDVPPGMNVYDDHILNIIIRGYGAAEQFQDVFTTVLSYSGIPAFWGRIYGEGRKVRYALSLVKLNGKWRPFDAYYGKYFRNRAGDIASVEDIAKDPSLVAGEGVVAISINGIPYRTFYYHLEQVDKRMLTRPRKQMPLNRFIYEVKRFYSSSR
jgi:hypothetical protein